jgi:hypothetical protein
MFDLTAIGKWLVIIGLGLALVGGGVWLAGRLGLPLGRLPGDFRFERGGVTFYFPIVSLILISLALSVLANVVARIFRR